MSEDNNGNGRYKRENDRAIGEINGKIGILEVELKNTQSSIDTGFKNLDDKLNTKFNSDDKKFETLFKTHNKMSSVFSQIKIQWWGIGAILLAILSYAFKII